ncbi:MAG: glycosyltransferase [Spirochaetes bacterium]|nr:glycosyltransferase [Spirochaetota bacterium]
MEKGGNGVRISLLAVTKDRVEAVRKAVSHWRTLKGKDDELVVIDGDSTDGTYEVLKQQEGTLIDLLVHEPDRSESDALNKGFKKARGSFIKIITDDDIFYPDELELAYAAMREHPDIDILITGGERAVVGASGGKGRTINYQWFDEKTAVNSVESIIGLCGIGMIIRTSSLARLGEINPDHYLADTSLLLKAHCAGADIRFMRVKGFLHLYHSWSAYSQNDKRKQAYRRIMRDFGLMPKGKLVRALQHPKKALSRIGRIFIMREPVWDGKLIG